MSAVTAVCLVGLGIAALLTTFRLIRPGGSLANRIVALDTLLIIAVSTIAVLAVRTGETAFIPVLLVVALVAFVGTVTVARFIERRGG
jgi:multicomponent Na+:H+ antiporter subunit F